MSPCPGDVQLGSNSPTVDLKRPQDMSLSKAGKDPRALERRCWPGLVDLDQKRQEPVAKNIWKVQAFPSEMGIQVPNEDLLLLPVSESEAACEGPKATSCVHARQGQGLRIQILLAARKQELESMEEASIWVAMQGAQDGRS